MDDIARSPAAADMSTTAHRLTEFSEIGALLWHGRRAIAGALILGLLAGFLAARMLPPVYLAEAMLIVRPSVVPTVDGNTPAAWLSATTRDVMATRMLVERALRASSGPAGGAPTNASPGATLGGQPSPIGEDEIEKIRAGLSFDAHAGSFAITVEQRSASPFSGAAFANALVEAFIQQRTEDLKALQVARRTALSARYEQAVEATRDAVVAATRLAQQPNALGALETSRQRIDELQQIQQSLALQVERLDATGIEPNVHFLSPAVVPARRLFASQILVGVGIALVFPGAVVAFLLLRSQFGDHRGPGRGRSRSPLPDQTSDRYRTP